MKEETKYPKEVTINGVIDGVKNPTAILFYDPKGNPAKYGIPEPDGKIKRYFDLWQVDAMPELFTPVTPKPKTHEIKILIDGQESRPFREIEEPGKIIIQSGSGSVATIDIGSGEEVDQVGKSPQSQDQISLKTEFGNWLIRNLGEMKWRTVTYALNHWKETEGADALSVSSDNDPNNVDDVIEMITEAIMSDGNGNQDFNLGFSAALGWVLTLLKAIKKQYTETDLKQAFLSGMHMKPEQFEDWLKDWNLACELSMRGETFQNAADFGAALIREISGEDYDKEFTEEDMIDFAKFADVGGMYTQQDEFINEQIDKWKESRK